MSTITPVLVPTGTWQVDGVHSSIGFAVKHERGVSQRFTETSLAVAAVVALTLHIEAVLQDGGDA